MRSNNLVFTLTAFQVRSAVLAILDLTKTQKIVILGLLVFLYGVLDLGVLDLVATVKIFLFLSPQLQAIILGLVFSSYLLLSNIFNQRLVISPQNSYLRHLPIEPKDFVWAHMFTLTILNLLFIGTYAFLLIRSIKEINISLFSAGFLFASGIMGMGLGQVHYAISSLKGIRRRASSLGIFWALTWSGWFLFSYGIGIPIYIYLFYISVCIVLAFQRVHSMVSLYLDTDFVLKSDIANSNLIYKRSSILGMVIIDYIALWRRYKRELIIHILLSFLIIFMSIFGVLLNDDLTIRGITAFVLFGSSVACLLLGSLVIKSQDCIAKNDWIKKVLPLNAIEKEIAEYLSLVLIYLPVLYLYFIAGQILFGLDLHKNLLIIGQALLLTTLMSAITKLLIRIKLDKIKVVFIQVYAIPFFIVVASLNILVFILILLIFYIAFWLVRVYLNKYKELQEEDKR